jgi:hypothetical protein
MPQVTFDTPVLKVEGLEVKFDTISVSASLAILLGNRDLALIVQQLHYWTLKGYGEVIDGVRWFYKPIKEWISEVFPTFTPYQMGKLMTQLAERGIIRREKLFTKHQIQNGDRFWWQPKNQTYYYSLNTEKLQELADSYQVPESAETPENSVFIKTQILSDREFEDTKDFDCAKNNTDITSIENISRDKSHPHLPCVCDGSEINKQDEKEKNSKNELLKIKEVNSFNSEAIAQEINIRQVEENINQNPCTSQINVQEDVQVEADGRDLGLRPDKRPVQDREKPATRTKIKTAKGTRSVSRRIEAAPWKDEGQFKRFYRALIQALPIVANSHSPAGLAQTIIRQLRCGIPHSYWDDFVAGLPIGSSTKPEWESKPGVPYPMFVEYLTEKLKAGNNSNSDEQTRNEVFRILSKPRQAKAFWGQFKRSMVNAAETVERDRANGVSNPSTPVWTRERIEPSISEAAAAGEKIMVVNGEINLIGAGQRKEQKPLPSLSIPDLWSDDEEPQPTTSQPTLKELLNKKLGKKNLKGFIKQMPKVSKSEAEAESRRAMKPKTNIAQMSVAEINDYLADPILRQQISSGLMKSDYQLITDELGQIIGVKAPPTVEE